MLQAIRSARPSVRAFVKPSSSSRIRVISTSTTRLSDHGPQPPSLFGPGAKPGQVPTDFQQATGLERLQLLGEMEGVVIFDKDPLDSSRIGTPKDPILVPSLDVERIIGCTGSPADSHDVLWFNVHKDKQTRCIECGSVYTINFQGLDEHHGEHAHH